MTDPMAARMSDLAAAAVDEAARHGLAFAHGAAGDFVAELTDVVSVRFAVACAATATIAADPYAIDLPAPGQVPDLDGARRVEVPVFALGMLIGDVANGLAAAGHLGVPSLAPDAVTVVASIAAAVADAAGDVALVEMADLEAARAALTTLTGVLDGCQETCPGVLDALAVQVSVLGDIVDSGTGHLA